MESYEEIPTSLGTIRGMLHIPKKKVGLYPIVICHGYFSSHRVGPARLYLEIARSLEKIGFYVGRFDCLGVGESDGDFSDVTFNGEIRDFVTIMNYILKKCKASKVIVIAHSMGGNLSLYCAQYHPNIIKGLILLSPDIQKLGGIDRLFTKKQLGELEKMEHTIRKGLCINASFINEIRNNERLFKMAKKLHIPTVIFHGKKDELYSIEGSKRLSEILGGELIAIRDGDHNYLSPHSRKELIEKLKEVVIRFNE